jgi:hypothetical protein
MMGVIGAFCKIIELWKGRYDERDQVCRSKRVSGNG